MVKRDRWQRRNGFLQLGERKALWGEGTGHVRPAGVSAHLGRRPKSSPVRLGGHGGSGEAGMRAAGRHAWTALGGSVKHSHPVLQVGRGRGEP